MDWRDAMLREACLNLPGCLGDMNMASQPKLLGL
jgi:hypothetical protein